MIFNPKTGEFVPKKGPVFTNILLADEINRAPAKVQSALLESMAEKQVTIGDITYRLKGSFSCSGHPKPPGAGRELILSRKPKLDRFMFKILVNYPNKAEELGNHQSNGNR